MNSKTRFFMKIIFAVLFVIFLGSNFFAEKTYAANTYLLTNLNNPNVFIFLDTSGSMMLNEGVNYGGSTPGYDAPESWLETETVNGHIKPVLRAPGSNSVFSKIYNAKLAISNIVTDSSFSNLNFAFATFDQVDAKGTQTSGTTDMCIYSNDGSFQNPSTTPDETGAYLIPSPPLPPSPDDYKSKLSFYVSAV